MTTYKTRPIYTVKDVKVMADDRVIFQCDELPVNPQTGELYFELRPDGWGDGWKGGEMQNVSTKELFGDGYE